VHLQVSLDMVSPPFRPFEKVFMELFSRVEVAAQFTGEYQRVIFLVDGFREV